MDRPTNTWTGGRQLSLLPESASSNCWHKGRDVDVEEMQGNGWGPGAEGKVLGRHRDRLGNRQPERRRAGAAPHRAGRRSAPRAAAKDSRASSTAEETLQLRDQHKRFTVQVFHTSFTKLTPPSTALLRSCSTAQRGRAPRRCQRVWRVSPLAISLTPAEVSCSV